MSQRTDFLIETAENISLIDSLPMLTHNEVSDHFADVGKMIQDSIHDPYL